MLLLQREIGQLALLQGSEREKVVEQQLMFHCCRIQGLGGSAETLREVQSTAFLAENPTAVLFLQHLGSEGVYIQFVHIIYLYQFIKYTYIRCSSLSLPHMYNI